MVSSFDTGGEVQMDGAASVVQRAHLKDGEMVVVSGDHIALVSVSRTERWWW
jgi:hypothetical protein